MPNPMKHSVNIGVKIIINELAESARPNPGRISLLTRGPLGRGLQLKSGQASALATVRFVRFGFLFLFFIPSSSLGGKD